MRKALPLMLAVILFVISGCENRDNAKTEVADEPKKNATVTIEPTKPTKLTIGVLYLDFYGKAAPPLDQVWVEDHTKIIIDDIDHEGIFFGSGKGTVKAEDKSVPMCTGVVTYDSEWDVQGDFDPDTCTISMWLIGYWVKGKQCTTCGGFPAVCESLKEKEWDLDVEAQYLYEIEVYSLTRNNTEWEYTFEFENFEETMIPKAFIKNCDLFIVEPE